MRRLYKLDQAQFTPCETICQYKSIEIIPIRDKVFSGSWKQRALAIYWYLLTLGKAKVYVIRDGEGEEIHSSHVISQCGKFPFMEKEDIEIGPCVTSPAYRGQGLYPYVLTEIVKNAAQMQGNVFMIVKDHNTASVRGVKKVGFVPVAQLKKDWMKRYVVVRRFSPEEKGNY